MEKKRLEQLKKKSAQAQKDLLEKTSTSGLAPTGALSRTKTSASETTNVAARSHKNLRTPSSTKQDFDPPTTPDINVYKAIADEPFKKPVPEQDSTHLQSQNSSTSVPTLKTSKSARPPDPDLRDSALGTSYQEPFIELIEPGATGNPPSSRTTDSDSGPATGVQDNPIPTSSTESHLESEPSEIISVGDNSGRRSSDSNHSQSSQSSVLDEIQPEHEHPMAAENQPRVNLPTFDGEGGHNLAQKFLEQFEGYIEITKIGDQGAYKMLPFAFKGGAYRWYKNIQRSNETWNKWSEYLPEFKLRYAKLLTPSDRQATRDACIMSANETVATFLDKCHETQHIIEETATPAERGINPRDVAVAQRFKESHNRAVCDLFLKGLVTTHNLRSLVQNAQQLTELDDYVALAEKIEMNSRPAVAARICEVNHQQKQDHPMNIEAVAPPRKFKKLPPPGYICYTCNIKGHYRHECPVKTFGPQNQQTRFGYQGQGRGFSPRGPSQNQRQPFRQNSPGYFVANSPNPRAQRGTSFRPKQQFTQPRRQLFVIDYPPENPDPQLQQTHFIPPDQHQVQPTVTPIEPQDNAGTSNQSGTFYNANPDDYPNPENQTFNTNPFA